MRRIFLALLLLLSAACNALSAPTPTPAPTDTPIPATDTPTFTPSPIPATDMPTFTPSPTLTPTVTDTPTPIPTPTNTPGPTTDFAYENWQTLDLPADISTRLQSSMLAFINTNNRTGSNATPQPGNNIETLYYVPPTNSALRVEILQLDASTGDQIFIAPTGDAVAYLKPNGTNSTAGLYIADFRVPGGGLSARVLPIRTLTQRNLYNPPSWAPDGSRMAIALATGYDIDIYTIGRDGSSPTDVTPQGSYDFWPVWSPDGANIAFVSDRAQCPSWIPGDPLTCDGTGAQPPQGGGVYVLNVATNQVRQISDQFVTEPPRWSNPRTIVYASGDPLLGDNQRALWATDVITGESQQITLTSGDVPLKLAESWSPDGQEVVFQAAGSTSTNIVLSQLNGTPLGTISNLPFARYGMVAAWSPDGRHIALGGVNGQCPYGVIVVDNSLNTIAQSNPPPTVCEPTYSPDGRFLAFTGINPYIDGRTDVYVANPNGLGVVNLTGSLRGQIKLLGWVGGQ